MAEQQQWFAGQDEIENEGLSLASDTEAYDGHLGKARELTKRSIDSAIRADSKEAGAIWQENAALREAAFGNTAEAKRAAAEALKLATNSQGVEYEAALAFAMAGDMARAESLAQDLNKRFPLDTQIQSLWLPAIRAHLALNQKNASAAVNDLQAAAAPIELGQVFFVANLSCTVSDVHSRRVVSGRWARGASRWRVPENSRPQRHRLELLDGSVSASGRGSCERLAIENFAGGGCRCGPRSCARGLQRLPRPLEGCRPRHPDPEAGQCGVREAAIARKVRCRSLLFFDG